MSRQFVMVPTANESTQQFVQGYVIATWGDGPTYGTALRTSIALSYGTGVYWSLINPKKQTIPPAINTWYGIAEDTDGQESVFALGRDQGNVPPIKTVDKITLNTIATYRNNSTQKGITYTFLDSNKNAFAGMNTWRLVEAATGSYDTQFGSEGQMIKYSINSADSSKNWTDLLPSDLTNLKIKIAYDETGGGGAHGILIAAFEIVIDYIAPDPTFTVLSTSDTTINPAGSSGRATKLAITEEIPSGIPATIFEISEINPRAGSVYPITLNSDTGSRFENVIDITASSLTMYLPDDNNLQFRYQLGTVQSDYFAITPTEIKSYDRFALLSGKTINAATEEATSTGATVTNTLTNNSGTSEDNSGGLQQFT